MVKDTIEIVGEYKSSSQTSRFHASRFHVKQIKVNGLIKSSMFNMPYTKAELMKLIGQIWNKIICIRKRTKITIIVEEI